jgi:hypothetical protein
MLLELIPKGIWANAGWIVSVKLTVSAYVGLKIPKIFFSERILISPQILSSVHLCHRFAT